MLKKAVQQGRSERRGEAYASVRWASERSENVGGGLFQHPLEACPTLPFVTRQRRCGQMRGRRPGKTGGLFGGIRWGFFRAENDADGCGSFAAV